MFCNQYTDSCIFINILSETLNTLGGCQYYRELRPMAFAMGTVIMLIDEGQ
jgi:hypothetical protein